MYVEKVKNNEKKYLNEPKNIKIEKSMKKGENR